MKKKKTRIVSQGTVSVLFGCHSVVHSVLVLLAWRRLYGGWPERWQAVCILIHDIGHVGLDYLDDNEQKERHWRLGAALAEKLYGRKGYDFVAGHCASSGAAESELRKPDKHSWLLAPSWFLWMNRVMEPAIRRNTGDKSIRDAVRKFREQVRRNIESGEYADNHRLYLERCGERIRDE